MGISIRNISPIVTRATEKINEKRSQRLSEEYELSIDLMKMRTELNNDI
jgi:hypothetical protein